MTFLVGGLELSLPIILGAGCCKLTSQLRPFLRGDVSIGAASFGSITPNAGIGNTGKLFSPDDYGTLERLGAGQNAFGMPNDGFEKSYQDLSQVTPTIPIIVSIAAPTIEGFIRGIQRFENHPAVSAHKLNISCPNKGSLPIGFDLETLESLLGDIRTINPQKPVWIKTPRYITREALDLFAKKHPSFDFSSTPIVNESFLDNFINIMNESKDVIRALVVANTLGNVIWRDPLLTTTPNERKAGLSGPIIRELSVALIKRFSQTLDQDIDIIGSGGILTGDHVMEYFSHSRVVAITATSGPFWYNDPKFFTNLIEGSERFQEFLASRMT